MGDDVFVFKYFGTDTMILCLFIQIHSNIRIVRCIIEFSIQRLSINIILEAQHTPNKVALFMFISEK